MADKLCILVCENFLREAVAAVDTEQLDDVTVRAVPMSCARPGVELGEIASTIHANEKEHVQVFRLCCGTCPGLHSPVDGDTHSTAHSVELWSHLFVGREYSDLLLSSGAYLISPGWLCRWRLHLEEMGFNRDMAREYFEEFAKRLVLIDSGVYDTSATLLEELGDYLGLSSEIIPVGLDQYRLRISNIILGWRHDRAVANFGAEAAQAQRQAAEYAMILDLASGLTSATTEDMAIDGIFNLFAMLFSPGILFYLPVGSSESKGLRSFHASSDLDAEIGGRLAGLNDDYEWTVSGNGFFLRIRHLQETVGALLIDELAFPAHKERYLNLALGISRVCGLAIANARAFATIERAKEEIRCYSSTIESSNAELEAANNELQLNRDHLETVLMEISTARDEAEAATRFKSQFLANMSHEIRTPMNAVMGMLHLLQRTTLSPRQRDYAKKIHGASQSLLTILNDILDFSKIEAGRLKLEETPFRLGELLRNLSVILSSAVQEKEVEVLFSVSGEIPPALLGDGLRLQQVLLNLASNAIKFTEQGEIVISVRALAITPEQTELEFSVKDTGIGISPDMLEHIFEYFTQAEASTTRRFGGTGLGLAICRQLVSLMGGVLKVESEPGQGSNFHFAATFKCDLGVQSAAVKNAAVLATGSLDRPLNALIVDDNAIAREVISAMVTSFGWRAETASSGPETIALVGAGSNGRTPYDVIFVDWKMPGMDGCETAEQIKALRHGDKAPIVIMITAHGREFLAKRFSEESSPLDGFLVKPITPSMLFDAVVDVTTGRTALANIPDNISPKLQRLAGMRLLVVEDNLINQQVAQEILTQEGATVAIADSGRQAIELCSNVPFNAVLMDIQMPEMDGYEATRRIREVLGMTELPIIAMTANALPADRDRCLAAGMNDHVGKPFDVDALIAIILQNCGVAVKSMNHALRADSEHTCAAHPGFDIDAALVRLGNNRSLYARMARTFEKDLGAVIERLRLHLVQCDVDSAAQEIHIIKGVAATLGVTTLSRVARDADAALKSNSPGKIRELLPEIDRLYAEACSVFQGVADELEPRPAEAEAVTQFDREALIRRMIELEALLATGNLRAIQYFKDVRLQLGHAQSELVMPLDDAMQRLDFSAAVELCQIVRGNI
jgi:signal transduction histidine kinase/DNA-binding response OmpR family regulator